MQQHERVHPEVLQFEKDLRFVRDFLDKLPKEVDRLYNLIGVKDQEKVDYLHHIEFVKPPAHMASKTYYDLHTILNERREAKDLHEVMSLAYDTIKGKIATATLSTALGEIRKVVKQQEKRFYNPRQLKELDYGESSPSLHR